MMRKSILEKPVSETQLETIATELREEQQKTEQYSQAEVDTIKRLALSASMLSIGAYSQMFTGQDKTGYAIVNKLYPNTSDRLKYGIVKVLDSLVTNAKEEVS